MNVGFGVDGAMVAEEDSCSLLLLELSEDLPVLEELFELFEARSFSHANFWRVV